MTQRAVILTGGKQYMVASGDRIVVDSLEGKEAEEIKLDKVLAIIDGEKLNIGQPYIEGGVVKAKILATKRGDKIRVARFRAKSRYRKVRGFRPLLTEIEVTGITVKSK
ncbi:MAG: 50S ribosomal protein L21 [Candidatus Roizmanbacteria bacterium]|nr:50S ribosomal protein L21 [Candidatus Roizmanbacteria bacterium]